MEKQVLFRCRSFTTEEDIGNVSFFVHGIEEDDASLTFTLLSSGAVMVTDIDDDIVIVANHYFIKNETKYPKPKE